MSFRFRTFFSLHFFLSPNTDEPDVASSGTILSFLDLFMSDFLTLSF